MIFSSELYPTSWLSSYIVPMHTSGDPFDPNNYRGISLLNGIAKIFSAILNNRIMLHMKDRFSNVQFGIRPNMRTADSLFLFETLINKYFNLLKKPIYSCFIDLRKAFDSVWRNGLFSKLQSSGIGSKTMKIIRGMYTNTKSSLKRTEGITDYFTINRGVRQGDSLNPTLSKIYINDMTELFINSKCDPLS